MDVSWVKMTGQKKTLKIKKVVEDLTDSRLAFMMESCTAQVADTTTSCRLYVPPTSGGLCLPPRVKWLYLTPTSGGLYLPSMGKMVEFTIHEWRAVLPPTGGGFHYHPQVEGCITTHGWRFVFTSGLTPSSSLCREMGRSGLPPSILCGLLRGDSLTASAGVPGRLPVGQKGTSMD